MKKFWHDSNFIGQLAADMGCPTESVQEWIEKQTVNDDGFIINQKHGSPYDRGAADSYYRRNFNPHWWPEGSYNGEVIDADSMTEIERMEYGIGFHENELMQNFKEWE